MAEDIVIEQSVASSLKPGTYDAIIRNIEEVENPFEVDRTQLAFTFEIVGQEWDGEPMTRMAWANPVWNSSTKLWGWVTAITGKTPGKDEPFRTSTLINAPCRVFVNKAKKKDGTEFTKIVDVLEPEQAAAPAAAKKPGLVSQLKKDGPPAGAAVSDPTDIGPCVVCDEPGTAFSGKGKPLCDLHAETPVELAM